MTLTSERPSAIEAPLLNYTEHSEHIPVTPRKFRENEPPFEKKNMFVEGWVYAGGGSSEEQNALDVPLHITTMAHDDGSPAGQMNFTRNSNETLLRRSISGRKGLEGKP